MNELVSIQTLCNELGISTRTLRHYEDVGLLTSVRPTDKQQRYYSEDEIRRIQQIRILRKMEIPIKDIIDIYQNAETKDIIEVFTHKITSIDENIATLTELRAIVEDFRQELLARGISSVSDLPALIDMTAEHKPVIDRMEQLEAVSEKRKCELLIRYMDMRPVRVLSNYLKDTNRCKAFCKGKRWEEKWNKEYERIAGGQTHEHYGDYFEGHSDAGHILHRRIPDDCVNDSPYEDYMLGGLFIVETTSNDPTGYDPGELWIAMEAWLKQCDYLELDDTRDPVYGINFGGMTKEEGAMWDLLIPVKKKI
ncbi:MAG: MerR family transcriptional regulator [Oscillospiraceae bacterium]|nr:MerR family transcriptional regulator [Oscillospiraceae bacterium]